MNMQSNQSDAEGSNAMAGINMPDATPLSDRSAPPVGSLPRSDGSAGKPDSAYGIGNGMTMDDDPLISKFMLDQLEMVQGNNGDQMA